MTKPHILYYDCLNYSEENLAYLRSFTFVETLPDPRFNTRASETMQNLIQAIFLPLGFRFDAPLLGKFTKLRVIASNTTTRPDVDLPEGYEVVYLNDKSFLRTITSTAEHTLGLIMALHRRIPSASLSKDWDRTQWGAPKMLSKMNLTIWGPGRVGMHLAYMAKNIFATVNFIDKGTSETNIKFTLKGTDVLVLTMNVEGPQPVVTEQHLMYLPRKALVVNTARGECLDNVALLKMLQRDQLRGAALDVLPGDHAFQFNRPSMLWARMKEYASKNDNLIITPHIAGSTEDAWHLTQRYVIDRVKEILV